MSERQPRPIGESGEGLRIRNVAVKLAAPFVAALALVACSKPMAGEKTEQDIINGRDFWVNESETVIVVSDTIERETPAISNTNDIGRVKDGECRIVKNPIFATVEGGTYMAYLPEEEDQDKEASLAENLSWVAYGRLAMQTQPQEEDAPYVISEGEPTRVDGRDVDIDGLKITANGEQVSVSGLMGCDDVAFVLGFTENPDKGE
jgi:hypothetical protein